MSSYFVENFGCRATQADGAAIERQMAELGLSRAASAEVAEVVVFNTCTVTAAADQDARAAIRRVHRENPKARIVVTGCYAQRAPHEIAALPGVTHVIGNSHKNQVAELASKPSAFVALDALTMPAQVLVGDIFAHTELLAAPVFESEDISEKTRPNLKVQDGCNNRCSFCVIPYTRGRSRSLKLGEVLREVDALVERGYREIVLSGINLGRWGRDLHPSTGAAGTPFDGRLRFLHLLRAILEQTAIEKVRISSVEPMDWSDELIDLVAGSPRVAKHAHVPLQSGSDTVLRRMHRRYRPWHYESRIRKIRELMPAAAIGADVMTGFPGESDTEFEESRSFIASLPYTYLHVFTYSARPGTPAADLPQVPVRVARARTRVLRELAREKNQEFRRSFIGQALTGLTLTHRDGDTTEALSDNYLKLRVRGNLEPNQWVRVQVESLSEDGLIGTGANRESTPAAGESAALPLL